MSISVSKEAELKSCQTQLGIRQGELMGVNEELANTKIKKHALCRSINDLKEKIHRLEDVQNPTEIVITEHAILRYLERVKEIDMEKVKAEMLTDRDRVNVMTLGTLDIKRGDYKIVIKNKQVRTVI